MSTDPGLEYESPKPSSPAGMVLSIISVVIGLMSCLGAIIPLCGCPISLGGLICGIIAMMKLPTDEKRGMVKGLAISGIILSSLGLLLTLINAAWGAYLGATGKHPLIHP